MGEWQNCTVKSFEWSSRLEKCYINTNPFTIYHLHIKPPPESCGGFVASEGRISHVFHEWKETSEESPDPVYQSYELKQNLSCQNNTQDMICKCHYICLLLCYCWFSEFLLIRFSW